MPNTYFQFKQFRVEQEKCAMKVCTDSCLFGAVVEVERAQRIMDIGTGTGLLALMVAQRSGAEIDAVEINPEAQQQAAENFAASPWANRLHLHPQSLQEFAKTCQHQYDVILSNPPFFLSSLKSGDKAKDTAKHTGDLLFEEILAFAAAQLTPDGKLHLLLPPAEAQYFEELATRFGLFMGHRLEVFTRVGGKCIRHIQTYTRVAAAAPATASICIREADAVTYTVAFSRLLQPFYLIF
ncbi:methyltransferase [Pontibacter qinzhouensis]|uniref:tRNA1(Val) (adenine(37)-N6)-methyltransferase n=1 Tax=Pontibacter qinzhouensis TaxID=2603253 RepID=A0A5C8K947_9BACT|nr:methyltransferase [Pontibacter qinzhouensis]TXK45925.1 methyltransferase [Pontibacter qinzhouensis]